MHAALVEQLDAIRDVNSSYHVVRHDDGRRRELPLHAAVTVDAVRHDRIEPRGRLVVRMTSGGETIARASATRCACRRSDSRASFVVPGHVHELECRAPLSPITASFFSPAPQRNARSRDVIESNSAPSWKTIPIFGAPPQCRSFER